MKDRPGVEDWRTVGSVLIREEHEIEASPTGGVLAPVVWYTHNA